MSIKISFKSTQSEKRWLELYNEKTALQAKKKTAAIEKKISSLTSLMTACKVGFNLSEAKVKKISKTLITTTGIAKTRYATIPDGVKSEVLLFKDVVVTYAVIGGEVLFREKQ